MQKPTASHSYSVNPLDLLSSFIRSEEDHQVVFVFDLTCLGDKWFSYQRSNGARDSFSGMYPNKLKKVILILRATKDDYIHQIDMTRVKVEEP